MSVRENCDEEGESRGKGWRTGGVGNEMLLFLIRCSGSPLRGENHLEDTGINRDRKPHTGGAGELSQQRERPMQRPRD